MDPLPDTDDYDVSDEADVVQLREQIHTLNQARKDDQETLRQVLKQLATLAVAQEA